MIDFYKDEAMKTYPQLFLILALSLFSMEGLAFNALPNNLDSKAQIRALEILGYGSAAKLLDNPYPLGGNLGLELGLTTDFIPLDDLANLGNKTHDTGEFNYFTLTFGKGLYNNFDVFLYFTPPIQTENIQNFGVQIKWGLYQATSFPINFSLVGYFGGANFNNLINITTTGGDLIASVGIDNLALYFGVGRVRAKGVFLGAPVIAEGITASGSNEVQVIDDFHSLFGLNVNLERWFFALEFNRYADSIYSGKIGYRF